MVSATAFLKVPTIFVAVVWTKKVVLNLTEGIIIIKQKHSNLTVKIIVTYMIVNEL
jgi:hypothetical protein